MMLMRSIYFSIIFFFAQYEPKYVIKEYGCVSGTDRNLNNNFLLKAVFLFGIGTCWKIYIGFVYDIHHMKKVHSKKYGAISICSINKTKNGKEKEHHELHMKGHMCSFVRGIKLPICAFKLSTHFISFHGIKYSLHLPSGECLHSPKRCTPCRAPFRCYNHEKWSQWLHVLFVTTFLPVPFYHFLFVDGIFTCRPSHRVHLYPIVSFNASKKKKNVTLELVVFPESNVSPFGYLPLSAADIAITRIGRIIS